MTMIYVPLASELVVEIVITEDTVAPGGGVTNGGLKVAVIFVGTPEELNVTSELNVPIEVTPISTVPLFPRIIDLANGAET